MSKPFLFQVGPEDDEEHVLEFVRRYDPAASIDASETLGRFLQTRNRTAAGIAYALGLKAHPASRHSVAEAKLTRRTVGELIQESFYGSENDGDP